jgi:hypothetical protein
VVLSAEGELDDVTRRCADTTRSENETVGTANNDLDGVSGLRDRGGARRVRVRRIGRRPYISTEGDGVSHERWGRGRGDGGGSVISGPSGTGRVLVTSIELGANIKSGFLEVGEGVGGSVSATVDGMDHTSSAMALRGAGSLVTENPDRFSIIHIDSVRGPIGDSDVGTYWTETRVNPALFVSARASERRLSHSVVLGVKVVDDLVMGFRENCLWHKNERTTLTTDLDVDDLGGNCRNKDKTDEWDEHGWQVRVRVG